MSDDDIRGALIGKRELEPGDMPWATGPKIKIAGQPDPDALKLAAEIRKKQAENERF